MEVKSQQARVFLTNIKRQAIIDGVDGANDLFVASPNDYFEASINQATLTTPKGRDAYIAIRESQVGQPSDRYYAADIDRINEENENVNNATAVGAAVVGAVYGAPAAITACTTNIPGCVAVIEEGIVTASGAATAGSLVPDIPVSTVKNAADNLVDDAGNFIDKVVDTLKQFIDDVPEEIVPPKINTPPSPPSFTGSGPVPGVIAVHPNVSSTKALENFVPKNGSVEFVFDPKTNTFAVGQPKNPSASGLAGSPH